jgi:hypothetical protein
VIFVESTENAGGEELAEDGARLVESLVKSLIGTGTEKLDAIGDETVHCTVVEVSMMTYDKTRREH